ncbi:T6SS amidase immunity protein Tai4 family protein [Commensalibacter intestini]|uniref:T6SS amidase immunity protein Tai4 family protein n=1 Tax=Commensalibacter intestini TaxID=479936 RepID=UPI000A3ADB09|nr:T6SS amidase immunity protein Tai4 family protein [Commensalibacter intestini]
MKKICIIVLLNCFYFINCQAMDKIAQIHYDKADIGYRNYGSNFKDSVFATCLQKAFGSQNPTFNEDAKATRGALFEMWINFDFKKTGKVTQKLNKLIQQYLNQPYGSSIYPKSKMYILKCMDLYHSDDLDKLTKEFVIHPNRTYKQDNPKYPYE